MYRCSPKTLRGIDSRSAAALAHPLRCISSMCLLLEACRDSRFFSGLAICLGLAKSFRWSFFASRYLRPCSLCSSRFLSLHSRLRALRFTGSRFMANSVTLRPCAYLGHCHHSSLMSAQRSPNINAQAFRRHPRHCQRSLVQFPNWPCGKHCGE